MEHLDELVVEHGLILQHPVHVRVVLDELIRPRALQPVQEHILRVERVEEETLAVVPRVQHNLLVDGLDPLERELARLRHEQAHQLVAVPVAHVLRLVRVLEDAGPVAAVLLVQADEEVARGVPEGAVALAVVHEEHALVDAGCVVPVVLAVAVAVVEEPGAVEMLASGPLVEALSAALVV